MNTLADMLVYLRKRDGISQQELADKIGMSRSIVGMYESGKRMPSFEVLETLADIFNVQVDFLVGRTDSGTYSEAYRENLAHILSTRPKADIVACGIDEYNTELIINGAIPLTFDYACELADTLGESIDSMINGEESATHEDDGLSEIVDIFKKLSPDNRSKLLELSRLYLNAQSNNE